jgi:hypothetical protein
MKIFRRLLLALLILLLIAATVVYWNLNGIVRRSIETQSTASLDLPTTLRAARLSILGATLRLDDLAIASPNGFQAPQMLALGQGNIKVSYGQLRSTPVHIIEIVMDHPVLVVEQAGMKLNLQAVMDRPSKSPPNAQPMRLIIDRLAMNNSVVTLRAGIPGLDREISVAIPSITLQNVGTGEGAQNGVAVKEVVLQVATALAAKAAESDQVPEPVRMLLAGNAKELAGKLLNDHLKQLTAQLEKKAPGAGAALGEILNQKSSTNPSQAIEKGLGGLLQSTTQPKRDRRR